MRFGRARRAAPAAAAAAVLYAALVRPRLARWGATDEELAAALPGDDLIPAAGPAGTMAATIHAPPSVVWPWLVQMGCDRAGFYSWDRLDNGGRPSAESIHPEWQDLVQGGRVLSVPNGRAWFDVALLEPERTLVLRATLSLPAGRPFGPAARPPRAFTDSTWGFHLRPTADGRTRLLVRGAGRGRPWWLFRFTNLVFWEPAHWVMQTKQFAELRRRAEREAPR